MAFENVIDTIRTYQTCQMVLEQLSYHELVRLERMTADEIYKKRAQREAIIKERVEELQKQINEYELDINIKLT